MDIILGNLSLLFEFPVVNIKIILDGVWGVMNVKNLAQGDFVIAGGYVSWTLAQYGLPPLLGVPLAFVLMWGLGWVSDHDGSADEPDVWF